MLTTSYECDERAITVPYDPIFDEVRGNSGFVDVRGRSDLAAQIPEGSGSRSLKMLLTALSETTSPVFTLGCDLGTHEESEQGTLLYGAGGYVQVMKANFASTGSEEYLALAQAISKELEPKSAYHHWELRHVHTWVDFRLGFHSGIIPSLWIWFIAREQTPAAAAASREILIAELHSALTTATITPVPTSP